MGDSIQSRAHRLGNGEDAKKGMRMKDKADWIMTEAERTASRNALDIRCEERKGSKNRPSQRSSNRSKRWKTRVVTRTRWRMRTS